MHPESMDILVDVFMILELVVYKFYIPEFPESYASSMSPDE